MTYSRYSLTQARLWLADCNFREVTRDYILSEATDCEIIHALERHYAGGWAEFSIAIAQADQSFELRTYSI